MTDQAVNSGGENVDRFGRKRNPRRTAVILVIAVIVGAGAFADYFYHPLKITPGAAVVVGDFQNTTNDAVFDGGLREVLAAELGQTPFLHVVSDEEVGQAMGELGQSPDAPLTSQLTRRVCNKLGAADAVNSSIALSEDGYEMLFEMVDCKTGKTVERDDMTSEDKGHIIDAVAKAASDQREKLGEPRETLKEHNATAEQLTSQSLVALHEYALGRRAEAFAGDPSTAELRYQKAVALDPRFTLAEAGLGRTKGAIAATVAKTVGR